MKIFKRMTTTLCSSLDNVAKEFENQEAMMKAAIREIKNSKAILLSNYKKAENEKLRVLKRIDEIKKETESWENRVKEIYSTNPELAKDCTRRIIKLDNEKKSCIESLEKNKSMMSCLLKETEKIDKHLLTVKQKMNELILKETTQNAHFLGGANSFDSLEEIIDRWEEKLIKNEVHFEHYQNEQDELDAYFSEEELEQKITEKLSSLTTNK